MADRGIGEFIAGFGQSFNQARANKQKQEVTEQIAKLQAKLIEAQLKAGNVAADAKTTLSDLMTGNRTQLELGDTDAEGIGTFRPTGAQVETPNQPLSLLETLADPQGQLAAIQSGAVGIGDLLDFESQERQRASIPDINALLGSAGQDDKGNPRFVPGGITIDPQKGPTLALIPNPEFNTSQQDELSALSLSTLTKDATEALEIESALEGSTLGSGFPFVPEFRGVKSTFATLAGAAGFDTDEQTQDVASQDRLDKLYGQILGIRLQRMTDSGETITNDKLAFMQEISPSTEKRPEANAKLMADFLQEELNRADIEQTKIPAEDRAKVLDFIRKARSGEFLQGGKEPVLDVPAISKMTMDQLEQIDPAALTAEAREAARKRYNELFDGQ